MQSLITFICGFVFAMMVLVPVVFVAYRLLIYERTAMTIDVKLNTTKATKEIDLLSERIDRLTKSAAEFNTVVLKVKNETHN